jgi:peptidylprolyl isomerase
MIRFLGPLLLALLWSCGPTQEQTDSNHSQSSADGALPDGLYAAIQTTHGELTCRLEYEKVPLTVANFVGLAEGTIGNEVKPAGEPYFDDIVFHRVVPNFMVQVGDPNTLPDGNPADIGRGNPGYYFRDEIVPSLQHNVAGTVSMANMGPNTNGSQFFITHAATPHLNGRHAVFGYVVQGLPHLYQIRQGDTLLHVEIIRQGAAAKAFDAPATFARLREGKPTE